MTLFTPKLDRARPKKGRAGAFAAIDLAVERTHLENTMGQIARELREQQRKARLRGATHSVGPPRPDKDQRSIKELCDVRNYCRPHSGNGYDKESRRTASRMRRIREENQS